jgi:hypothetical protein
MYIVFILQYQKVQINCQILPKKRTETNIVLIILYGAYYRVHDYTDTVSYPDHPVLMLHVYYLECIEICLLLLVSGSCRANDKKQYQYRFIIYLKLLL